MEWRSVGVIVVYKGEEQRSLIRTPLTPPFPLPPCPSRTLTPFGENVPATCVSFDHSGLYLAVGGPEVKIFGAKQDWAELGSLSGFPKKARTLAEGGWGFNCHAIAIVFVVCTEISFSYQCS